MKNILFLFISLLYFNYTAFSQFTNIVIDDSGNPNEPSIAINLKYNNQLISGSNINNVYISNDTGRTWTAKTLNSDYGVWGDPAIISDTSGNFYFFHLSNATSWIDRIVCQKSNDYGNTWYQDSYMGYNQGKNQDKEWAIIDHSNNNIYCSWTQFDSYDSADPADSSHILFSKSIDGGNTWSEALRIDKKGGDCLDDDKTTEGAVPAVGPEGQIYISWADQDGIKFDKSYDQGNTWMENDIFVSDMPGGWNFNIPGVYRSNGLPITICDISDGPYKGNIYINWSDQRNGEDDTDIWVVKSEDNGNTWSEPIRVNNDLPGKQQFFTWMTIDQSTGYLYCVFYDRRNYDDNNTDVFLAVSRDGGNTFSNTKISTKPFIPTENVFFGDYTNISAVNGIIRPVWARLENYKMSILTAIIDDNMLTNTGEMNYENNFFELFNNYPNPFYDKAAISFKLHQPSKVSLQLTDILGNSIELISDDEILNSGKHTIIIDRIENNLVPGIYFYSLRVGNKIETKKMILV